MASSSETAAQKKIILVSSDGQIYEIDEAAAEHSQTLKNMIEDECADNPIPLPNVTSDILAKVIEYCKQHTQQSSDVELLKQFDTEFVMVDQRTLFNTLLAANYLNISSLMDLLCKTVADMIKNKTPEQIRETFHIVNDYTKEEEEDVRRENAWAFE